MIRNVSIQALEHQRVHVMLAMPHMEQHAYQLTIVSLITEAATRHAQTMAQEYRTVLVKTDIQVQLIVCQ